MNVVSKEKAAAMGPTGQGNAAWQTGKAASARALWWSLTWPVQLVKKVKQGNFGDRRIGVINIYGRKPR